MTSKKLGALLRSVPPATARAEAAEPPPLAAPGVPEPLPEPPLRRHPVPSAVEQEVPLQVLIPESIRRQLGVKAAEEGKSLRELVLTAVRSLGVAVTDAQIRGKRGRKAI